MIEILFKAKTESGRWIEGDLIHYQSGEVAIIEKPFSKYGYEATEICRRTLVLPDTVCQYTGLTDKNGNKIWENDIVKCNYNNYGEKGTYIGKVIFREDTCTFIVTDGKSTDYEWWNEEKEVIGNIFDNACIDELLKGEEG